MREFDDELTDDIIEETEDWSAFDDDVTDDSEDLTEEPEVEDWSAFDDDVADDREDLTEESEVEDLPSEADKAADYARSKGFDKLADYIKDHYDGDEFDPHKAISITTRNMDLEGSEQNGIPYTRREVELAEDLVIEGVFAGFDAKHTVELGDAARDMSLHHQFKACKEDFQEHMFDDPSKLEGITFGDMFRLDKPNGYAPEGWTWHHNEVTGRFELVSSEEHSKNGHTGGDALW